MVGDLKAAAEKARSELVERVADTDEELAEKFLLEEPISGAELQAAIRRATIALKFVPIFMGRYARMLIHVSVISEGCRTGLLQLIDCI